FTAEEAWQVFGPKGSISIFTETYIDVRSWRDEALLARWARIAEVRAESNRQIEVLRAEGKLGSSLQAEVTVKAAPKRLAELATLGDDLRFVLITSAAYVESAGDTADASEFFVHAAVSGATKCERCWHYRTDVGIDAAHPTICGRCTSNLFGAGEPRRVA
ncbi:MAG: isoleucine--tRNA ligase, partial [Pseudomonadota bacterium]|nr:isoleucine--tRNA ligase [Pseudomonadota bacterium]